MKTKKSYWEHTNKRWKKAGDALLISSSSLTAYAVVEEIKWLALTALIVGVVGKFLTNLFSDESNPA